ncbi:CD27 antigen isoform X2 [Chelmon rostratus]|uniref:CD27 antigen isoform X2 n=1 Tax=Chelmon rostratus TaxID=109905 RepID=UPI001BEAAECF|nr:CD27 antigen isoform X2 [Chelmon rostratus]
MSRQMWLLCYFAFLCSLSVFSPVLSECNETQYAWPVEDSKYCCNKCPPGRHLVRRFDHCQAQCDPCPRNQYRDTYNVEMTCKFCGTCNRPNMEYKSHCNGTHNVVCKCKAGYECEDQSCGQCVPILSTTNPTLPSTSALKSSTLTTLGRPHKSLRDTIWLIIGLLSAVIAFFVGTKISPFLRWIKSKHGYLLTETCAPVPPCSEDEEVSKPVQEAGNVTNLKIDPELGLAKNLQTTI